MNWRKLASLTFAVMLVLSLLPTVGLAQDTKDMPQLSDKVDKELADLLAVRRDRPESARSQSEKNLQSRD